MAREVLGTRTLHVNIIADTPSASQNDYAPTGWSTRARHRVLRLTPTASIVITGIGNGVDGDVISITNNGTFLVVLAHQNTSSSAANRFDLAKGILKGHWVLFPGDCARLVYDGTASRWWPLTVVTQDSNIGRQYASIKPGSGTAPIANGLPFTSQGGTISHPAIATGSVRSGTRRWRGATGGTAGTQSGGRVALGTVYRGDAAGRGGFLCRYRWGYSTLPAAAEASFVGLLGTTSAPGNADTQALLNVLGWGKDPSDTQLRLYVNDGSGACTETGLGANFPINTTAWYDGIIYSQPNGSAVSFCVWRVDDLTITPDVRDASSDIPSTSTFLAHHVWICNRAAAASYEIECSSVEQLVP